MAHSDERDADQPTEQVEPVSAGAPDTGAPTEQFGQPGQPAQSGQPQWAPTLAYPTTQAYYDAEPDAHPGVGSYPVGESYPGAAQADPTRAYGAYATGATGTQPTEAYPTAGDGSAGGALPPEHRDNRRTVGFTAAALVAVGTLVVGLCAGYLIGTGSSTTSDSSASAPLEIAPAQPGPQGSSPGSGQGSQPGGGSGSAPDQSGGGLDGSGGGNNLLGGGTIGTIASIDGSSFSLHSIDGSSVSVKTTPQTKVASLHGSGADALAVGDMVLVQGSSAADGTITAKLVIAGALPHLGGGGGPFGTGGGSGSGTLPGDPSLPGDGGSGDGGSGSGGSGSGGSGGGDQGGTSEGGGSVHGA